MKLSGKLNENGLQHFIDGRLVVGAHKMPRIWVLVVNAEQAYFFLKINNHLEKIGESLRVKENKPEIASKTSGRMPSSSVSSKREPYGHSLHHEIDVFLKALAEYINNAAKEKAFDRLVMIAAPKTLGVLRPLFTYSVKKRINAELNKDLINLNEKQLFNYLNKIIWI